MPRRRGCVRVQDVFSRGRPPTVTSGILSTLTTWVPGATPVTGTTCGNTGKTGACPLPWPGDGSSLTPLQDTKGCANNVALPAPLGNILDLRSGNGAQTDSTGVWLYGDLTLVDGEQLLLGSHTYAFCSITARRATPSPIRPTRS